MRKFITTLFVSALLLSPHSLILQTQAAEPARARGVIRAVDLNAGTVTILTRSEETLVLNTNERTQITRNEERAMLEDLQQSDRATVLYDASTKIAAQIDARGVQATLLIRVEGVIAGVNTEAHTITIDPIRNNQASAATTTAIGDPITLHVSPNTSITLDGRPARLEDLHRGFSAGAAYNPDNFEAVRIAAESFAEVRGVVRDVGVVLHTLTIEPSTGEPAITLIVGPSTTISLNGRPATLEDLRRGYRVIAAYVEATLLAVRIAADSLGEVTGHIRDVDVATATVVITPLVDGPAVELQVVHSTVITIGGEPASLDRLRPGMAARAVFNIVSFEALLIEARPLDGDECTELRVVGRISNVSLHSSTVTIVPNDPAFGERLTLNVVERTEITIGGRPARLSDLSEGMRAVAIFCRETLVAKSIAARVRQE
jgi:Cu/Ag efflux protein CusF